MSFGDLLGGLADVAVRFKASHAQCDASAHNDSVELGFDPPLMRSESNLARAGLSH